MLYANAWGSITKLTQNLIAEFKLVYPDAPLEYFDWDSHATANELPSKDLVGPLALAITQHSTDMYAVSFSIGVSTYSSDHNLFRQRYYIGKTFEKMLSGQTIDWYNAESASRVSKLVMTDGTVIAPMSKAELRPWQFVQGEALLLPVGAS